MDAEGRQSLSSLLRELKGQGRTVCFATHEAAAATSLADRIVRMERGRMEAAECRMADPAVNPVSAAAA